MPTQTNRIPKSNISKTYTNIFSTPTLSYSLYNTSLCSSPACKFFFFFFAQNKTWRPLCQDRPSSSKNRYFSYSSPFLSSIIFIFISFRILSICLLSKQAQFFTNSSSQFGIRESLVKRNFFFFSQTHAIQKKIFFFFAPSTMREKCEFLKFLDDLKCAYL